MALKAYRDGAEVRKPMMRKYTKISQNFNKRQIKNKLSDAEKEDYRIGRQIWIIDNPRLARNLRTYEDLSDKETTDDEHYNPEYGY